MGHVLNWTPGSHGKGIVHPNGTIETWNVDEMTGDPHHSIYMEGQEDGTGASYVTYHPFEIDPEGKAYDGPADLDKIDPRLVPTPKWRFQSATNGPVEVKDVNHPVGEEPHAPAYCEGPLDKPFVYDPAERVVYLGQPGGYHTDMINYIPGDNPAGWPQGRLRNPHTEKNPYTDEMEHTPLSADWFFKPPENHEAIHQALGAGPLTGKWAWHFQANAEHRLGWNPGQWGKGLMHNGAVHTWNVGRDEDGFPTHADYAQVAFGMNENRYLDHMMFNTAFWISPKGRLNVYDDNALPPHPSSHPEDYSKVSKQAEMADPRLHTDPSQGWDFTRNFQSRVTKTTKNGNLSKTGMPVGKNYWQQFIDSGHGMGPGYWYHGTSPERLDSIMQHGLHPWDSDIAGGTNYQDMPALIPRPGHIYMAQDPSDARDRGLDSTEYGARPLVLRVDPSYLNPEHINPDEDFNKDHPTRGESSGEFAESTGFGDNPAETQNVIDKGGHIGYRGTIPPEALTPGTYDVDWNEQIPRRHKWRPTEWPRTVPFTSRIAVTAPWEFGRHGKGLYYPETGTLQTWTDDRLHTDVWFDDENYAQSGYAQSGAAHHIEIRPNGTVHDQGALNRDFGDAESDVEGLQIALRALDPRLRLDAPSDWSFGPTEPVEEEPSAISRGEEGGQNHDVQTSNDYPGSL